MANNDLLTANDKRQQRTNNSVNPGDALADAVFAFLEGGANDIYGLSTAYAWYIKQCGGYVDMYALAHKAVDG